MLEEEQTEITLRRFLFIVDPVDTLNPGHDSSVAVMEAAQRRGHSVSVATMRDLEIEAGHAIALAQHLEIEESTIVGDHWVAPAQWFRELRRARERIDDFDAVFIRTDPPVSDDYIRGTYILDLVDTSSTIMINAPAGIRDANEKLFALRLPHLGPDCLVSADVQRIVERTADWGRAVLKPTNAMAGRGVLMLDPDDPNLYSILENATARSTQHVVVQRWIDGATSGDRRIILLDGEPIGAVRRVAMGRDFRCNMASGAVPVADEVTEADRILSAALAPELRRLGLIFVGIDVIAGFLTEVNVTSPTGLREIDALSDTRLGDDIVLWVERQLSPELLAT